MITINLICVGNLKEKFWKDAVNEYEKRLAGYCKLEILELPEQRLPDKPSDSQITSALEKEAELIRSKIPQGAAVIAMCIEGKTMSSEALADKISEFSLNGISRLAVLIGGSFGMDEQLKKQASLRLSMSSMTFPHHLARVMVLEQIYRALNIQAGGKYHK